MESQSWEPIKVHTSREAKPLDNQGAKIRNTTVGNIPGESKQEENPYFPIQKSFKDLFRFHRPILYTRLVVAQTLDGQTLLAGGQLRGRDGRIGKENDHDDTPDTAEGPDDEKLVLPRRKSSLDLADAVSKEPTNGNAEAVRRIP